jgi:hypothetical protein
MDGDYACSWLVLKKIYRLEGLVLLRFRRLAAICEKFF